MTLMPGTCFPDVIRSTICAKEDGYGESPLAVDDDGVELCFLALYASKLNVGCFLSYIKHVSSIA